MQLQVLLTLLLLKCCWTQASGEECKTSGNVNDMMQQVHTDFRQKSANLIRYCVAQCLDLVNFNGTCKFNPVSGMHAGACTSRFQPNPKNTKTLLCYVENLNNPYSKFNLTKLIRSGLCTHITLAPFFFYHKSNATLTILRDVENMYADDLKLAPQFNTKILLSVGEFFGSTMQTDNFGKIASSEQSRVIFAEQMADFISKHNLGGIVINWLAPGCIKLNCVAGSSSDKFNFVKMLVELRKVLKPDMEIIISVPGSRDWLPGFDFEKLFPLVDYFQILSFVYCSHEFPSTGHTSPLPQIKAIMEFLKKYASKLLVGINGRVEVFKLAKKQENKLGAKMLPGQGAKTFINQICKRVSKMANSNRLKNVTDANVFCKEDPYGQLNDTVCEVSNSTDIFVSRESEKGNYAAFDNNWFSFEDKDTLFKKVELINAMGSPGVFLSAVNYDDANNMCGCVGDFALTRTVAEILRANEGCTMKSCF